MSTPFIPIPNIQENKHHILTSYVEIMQYAHKLINSVLFEIKFSLRNLLSNAIYAAKDID